MSKKLILVLVMLFFLSSFGFVRASDLLINEFVSDPDSGPEWIELLNTSSADIDLNGWVWTELASPGDDTEHESSRKELKGIVPAGGVFVFEMNKALNNNGDSIGLYYGENLEDRVTFGTVNSFAKDINAPTKGKSGAFINGSWKTNQTPTKEELNPNSPSDSGHNENNNEDSNNNDSDSSSDADEDTTETKTSAVSQKVKIEINAKSLAYVGIPFSLEGRGWGNDGLDLHSGRYFWNFGDGDFREVKATGSDRFNHTYFYPGDYIVSLEYYPDFFAEVPEVTEKLTIKVIIPEVSISNVGDTRDFFVELANNTNYNMDLSGWSLVSSQRNFTIPHNTILAANKKMVISSRITGFTILDKATLRLITSGQEVAFDYNFSPKQTSKIITPGTTNLVSNNKNNLISAQNLSIPISTSQTASVLNSGILSEEEENSAFPIIPLISFAFIGISASVVYFIRYKKTLPAPGDNFEILDE